MDTEQAVIDLDVHKAAKDIIGTIDKEREREIISRRFGLYDRKETLEQIGELLGITRERVRQLEKATLTKMKATVVKPRLSNPSLTLISATRRLMSASSTVRRSSPLLA